MRTVSPTLAGVFVVVAFLSPARIRSASATQAALPAPQFEYSTSVGCGNVFFHAVNSTHTEILQIEADFARLSNVGSVVTFDLAHPSPGVSVNVTRYSDPESIVYHKLL